MGGIKMREWKKPNITGVKLDRTEAVECGCITNDPTTFAKDPNKNQHFCHRDNMWHQNNCMSLHAGHDQSAKCPTGGNHEWAGQSHKSKCCCGSHSS